MAGWTSYQILLATVMLITGSINTLSTKWADQSYSVGIDGKKRIFDHPFLQSAGMFLGELSCLLVFYILVCRSRRTNVPLEGNRNFNPFIFLPASLCDMCGTSIMYVGLNLTFASSFQMLRGAVIIFTALLSVAFLGRKIHKHMWLGMFIILIGLALVGVSDIVFNGAGSGVDVNRIIAGDLLIIMAQVIVAVQMTYEERVIGKHNVAPLQAVGFEGLFGFVILGLLMFPMYFIIVKPPFGSGPHLRLEDALDGFIQMKNSWQIILATAGNILSIAFFNFSGISVTKEMSATTRMVLDSCRTLVIWAVSLAVKWQPFTWPSFCVQLAGFLLLVIGMCVYNDLVFAPLLRRQGWLKPSERDMPSLIDEQDINSDPYDVEPSENTPILGSINTPGPLTGSYTNGSYADRNQGTVYS